MRPLPARSARPALLALTAAALLAARLAGAVAAAPDTAPRLVVLGDSLSAGYGIRPEESWVALLGRRLQQEGYEYRVVNASVSGETSGGGLARLPRVLATHHPSVLIVELGANDGLRGLPVPALRHNLEEITAAAGATGARVLLIGMRMPENYGPEYTARFAASFAEVAKARKVALVPFLLERVALDEANFQRDQMHPIAAVQPQLLDAVWPRLKPLLGPAPAPGAR
jgi:acyl-CoA thioesterase I